MTNTEMLLQMIGRSGLKIKFICDELGLTYTGFREKLNNRREFKASEILKLSGLLNLTAEEREIVFFTEKVN